MPAILDSTEIDLVGTANIRVIDVSSRFAMFRKSPTETFEESEVKVRLLGKELPAARLGQRCGNGEST